MLSKPFDFWKRIIFTDESKFNLFGSDEMVMAWRNNTEEFKEHCVKPTFKHGGDSVMVWGCFSSGGVGKLLFIEGIMRKEDYLEILKSFVIESVAMFGLKDSFIFQQDHDPKHTARIVTNWIHENGIDKLHWVAQSLTYIPSKIYGKWLVTASIEMQFLEFPT